MPSWVTRARLFGKLGLPLAGRHTVTTRSSRHMSYGNDIWLFALRKVSNAMIADVTFLPRHQKQAPQPALQFSTNGGLRWLLRAGGACFCQPQLARWHCFNVSRWGGGFWKIMGESTVQFFEPVVLRLASVLCSEFFAFDWFSLAEQGAVHVHI